MSVDRVLSALADPTRRQIVERLRERPSSVGNIAADMPVSRPAVSQHLKVLREAGLVWSETVGTSHVYHIDPAALMTLRQYVDTFWGDVLHAFQEAVEKRGKNDDS